MKYYLGSLQTSAVLVLLFLLQLVYSSTVEQFLQLETDKSDIVVDVNGQDARFNLRVDDGSHGSWFAEPISTDLMKRRNRNQYPFVSVDYYISKANTVLDKLLYDESTETISRILRYQYDQYGKKPIIFMPSEYILHYAMDLVVLNITFTLITVSNQPMCMPYVTFPPICEEDPFMQSTCDVVNLLLANPHLDKWFTKNPCIFHPKIHPIPVGPKWQFSSRLFYGDSGIVGSYAKIYRTIGLKPFALFQNFSHLLLDTSHNVPQRQLIHAVAEGFSDEVIEIAERVSIDKALISNKEGFDSFVQKQRERNPQSWFLKIERATFPGKDRLLYFNFFANNTDKPLYRPHANTRRLAYDSLIGQGFQPSPVRQISGYLQDLSEHKFCISPPGVGLDAHRTWEALMVGTIPIVMSSPLNGLFEDLPVVIVDSYSLITPESLEEMYQVIQSRANKYDFSKLYVHYWDKVIN